MPALDSGCVKTEEMVGQSITTIIPAGRHDEEAGILDRIRCGERIEHYETIRQRKDGRFIDIAQRLSGHG